VYTLIALVTLIATGSSTPEPTARELLRKYDSVMGPEHYEAVAEMTSNRDDGTQRTYKMRVLKSGDKKLRMWFTEPAAVRGQEMLRQGENLWVYLPNLKRATRLAGRESFQGGDFNNADVLRVNYETDYEGQLQPQSKVPNTWELELKARTSEASYDRVKLWLSKPDGLPVQGEFYSASGKMLRAAEFSDVRNYGGFRRPAKILMKNMIATKRWSSLVLNSMNTKVNPPLGKFVLDDLGR
jgi:outer membrane lipoprotein-sorting protein